MRLPNKFTARTRRAGYPSGKYDGGARIKLVASDSNQTAIVDRSLRRLGLTANVSVVDPSVMSGAILPSGHPFTNVQGIYWSATSWADNIFSGAWGLDIEAPAVNPYPKSDPHGVWCVRGGQGVDPQ